jgi:hypothetical protein
LLDLERGLERGQKPGFSKKPGFLSFLNLSEKQKTGDRVLTPAAYYWETLLKVLKKLDPPVKFRRDMPNRLIV